jgi:hypothetical protein
MLATNNIKIKDHRFSISVRTNAPKLIITNETIIPNIYKKEVVTIETDREELKKDLANGVGIDGCFLARGTSLVIK